MARQRGRLLWGLAAGAAAMYFFDPRSGRRRRVRVRDRAVRAGNEAREYLERVAQDAGNRTRGTVARLGRRVFSEGPVDDGRLRARARAILGRVCSHPHAIEVEAQEGAIHLQGPILEQEVADVLTAIRRVPGVRRVESRLESVRNPSGVPALQGGRQRTGLVPDLLQRNLSPTSQAILGMAGGFLALWGLRRGGLLGTLGAAAGGTLLVRAGQATALGRARGAPGTVPVQKSIEVQAPLEEVFAFWSNFQNFPRFMQHLREVRQSEGGISHWIAEGPMGIPISWDAELTALEPHRRSAWRSLEGSDVSHSGQVLFEAAPSGGTRITVQMAYSPPAGTVGHTVATLFGADPKHQLDDDLLRFKSLLETGKATAHGHEVTRQDVQPEKA